MASKQQIWVRKELSKRMTGVSSKAKRTAIMRKVWKEAKSKFN